MTKVSRMYSFRRPKKAKASILEFQVLKSIPGRHGEVNLFLCFRQTHTVSAAGLKQCKRGEPKDCTTATRTTANKNDSKDGDDKGEHNQNNNNNNISNNIKNRKKNNKTGNNSNSSNDHNDNHDQKDNDIATTTTKTTTTTTTMTTRRTTMIETKTAKLKFGNLSSVERKPLFSYKVPAPK